MTTNKELFEKEFAGIDLILSDENDLKVRLMLYNVPEIPFDELGELVLNKMSETVEDLIENHGSGLHVENADEDKFSEFLSNQTFWATNFGELDFDTLTGHKKYIQTYYYFD